MKTENLSKIFGAGESTVVEWKQSLAEIDKIIKSAVAFANTEGGRVYQRKRFDIAESVCRDNKNFLKTGQ